MICKGCKRNEDLRFGWCFDCATQGENYAAHRTVVAHIAKDIRNFLVHSPNYRYDFIWALERLTRTGDYRVNSYFENEYGKEIWK